ncbi:alpha/beta hydrolase [Helcococcus kunzii]|uniref:BD-FAE-like domain-containing protein n=1 Tax=Helcococcus kunzii ATCC 51366 TaxID=883114 RepID=H3NL91_9FIRM|nr:alpha/beta hydrolase [Helcococcus kunzii]EHR36072.1 hypothetical protein HMPREF9709_00168 [Helcococcus kunzii ATCC 51366]
MKSLIENIDNNGAYVKYYLQEPNKEIDIDRKYPTIVICPGGAYFWTSYREDEYVALKFLSEGFNVAVVHYATEGLEAMNVEKEEDLPKNPVSKFPNPLISLAKVVKNIREHSKEWSVDENYIIVGGFSAGGNLTAQYGTLWNQKWLSEKLECDSELLKPTHLMLAYAALNLKYEKNDKNRVIYAATGKFNPTNEELQYINPIRNVSKDTPPSFIWHTLEDVLVPATDSLEFALELNKYEIPYELHIFNKAKHGLVLGDLMTGVKADQANAQVYKWVDLFIEWLSPYKTIRRSFYKGIEKK